MDCRDWLSTLWSASFRGFPFYFESDEEEGGRGLVVHEFPNRDIPYVEDLGAAPRTFSGSAYVHGDAADALAVAFAESLAGKGPATLVVPVRGPVLVHCQSFRRRHERDKLGFVAFEVKFVREGAASALVSLPALAHQAYAAADALAAAIADTLPRTLAAGEPDYVAAAAADEFAAAAAALDGLRLTYPVAPDVSARLRDELADLAAAAPAVFAAAMPATAMVRLVSAARDLADAMPPDSAARAMIELYDAHPARVTARPYLSPAARAAADNADAAARAVRLAALTAWTESLLRRTYRSRPEGVDARAEIAVRFEAELAAAGGAENADLYLRIGDLRGQAVAWITALINDLAPVITVEAARIMPSLFWAWRLYADPRRAGELVARNAVRHPSFMPVSFSALAR